MSRVKYTSFVADFETSVYKNQEHTEVWASAIIPLEAETHPDNVIVNNCIEDFLKYIFKTEGNKKIYFHNLKFDGTFILSWLLNHGFSMWTYTKEQIEKLHDAKRLYTMPSKKIICMIGQMGQWYSITTYYNKKFITFVDSLKLLPFSVSAIGKGFNTKYQKLSIEYEGERHAGEDIPPNEVDYIKNDVLVVHEALKQLFNLTGMEKMTIGSMCLEEFKNIACHGQEEFKRFFPDLSKTFCPIDGFNNADEYIRKSYHGGFCYVKKGEENKIHHNGSTADVNSLYPSMMHSESGNIYPYGSPEWFRGEIPDKVIKGHQQGLYYYFVRIKCAFHVKNNKLPCIQIKNNPLYHPRKWQETSDINGVNVYRDIDGVIQKCRVEMVLTCTDFQLIQDHYTIEDLEILDGCYFFARKGFFDEYINKWARIKQESKGAKRTLAKLFLNNLYGKMASSTDSSYKIPFLDEYGILKNKLVYSNEKDAGFIAIGSAITSYARNFTIRHAQKNYKHFIYADTDSIHCTCKPSELKDIKQHDTAFQYWKIENEWDKAVFVRAKTYIEHNIKEDGQECEPYYNIKCAGMGKNAKKVLQKRLEDKTMSLKDFRVGLIVPHNLKAKQIKGGTVLVDMDYIMHPTTY